MEEKSNSSKEVLRRFSNSLITTPSTRSIALVDSNQEFLRSVSHPTSGWFQFNAADPELLT
jgi:hypothetical protein